MSISQFSIQIPGPQFDQLAPFQKLVAIMAALRHPQTGCPWDLKQTHRTLTPYLIEEAYEAIEAIESDNFEQVCDELGDVLLQVVFHAQLAHERDDFDIDNVCNSIVDKMLRRHPHVFGEGQNLEGADQVLEQWDAIKRKEKGDSQGSELDRVSTGLPPLSQATLLQTRAARLGFKYPNPQAAMNKLKEEVDEFNEAPSTDELGDILFAAVSLAHQHGIDPDEALRSTNRKFRRRFAALEKTYPDGLANHSPEQLQKTWTDVARAEYTRPQ